MINLRGTTQTPLSFSGPRDRLRRRLYVARSRSFQLTCGASKSPAALQVVFVSTEVAPWSKTGGLADVMSSLPAALAARGHKVMTVSPRYGDYAGVFDTGLVAPVEVAIEPEPSAMRLQEASGRPQQPCSPGATEVSYARYYVCHEQGVLRVFVDHPVFGTPYPGGSTAMLGECSVVKSRTGPARQDISNSGSCGQLDSASNAVTVGAGTMRTEILTEDVKTGRRRALEPDPVLADLSCSGPSPTLGPGLGVYTYSDGEGLSHVDLQARNNVLCQAALAAPVLLWLDSDRLPSGLKVDLKAMASSSCGVPQQALPFVLHQGIAAPAITLEPRGAEWLRTALASRRWGPHSSSHGAASSAGQHPFTRAASGLRRVADALGVRSGMAGARQPPDSDAEVVPEVVFVGNDWPSALLPLWLQTYREIFAASALPWDSGLGRVLHLGTAGGPERRAPDTRGSASVAASAAETVANPSARVPEDSASPPLVGGADDEVIAAALSSMTCQAGNIARRDGGAEGKAVRSATQVRCRGLGRAAAEAPAPVTPTSAPQHDVPRRHALVVSAEATAELQRETRSAVGTATVVLALPEASALPVEMSGNGVGDALDSLDADAHFDSGIVSRGGGDSDGAADSASALTAPTQLDSTTRTECPTGLQATQPSLSVIMEGAESSREVDAGEPLEEEIARQEAVLVQLLYTLHAINRPGLGESSSLRLPAAGPAGDGAVGSASAEIACGGVASDELTGKASLPDRAPEVRDRLLAEAVDARDDPQVQMRRTLQSFRAFVASRLNGSKAVLAVHNFAFQGLFSADTFWRLGLPLFALQQMLLGPGASPAASSGQGGDSPAPDGGPPRDPVQLRRSDAAPSESQRFMSWLKGALLSSDLVVTVSPTYADELMGMSRAVAPPQLTDCAAAGSGTTALFPLQLAAPTGASELCEIVAARGVQAIMNGLDESLWNPSSDPLLPAELWYDRSSVSEGKARAKAELQARLGLNVDPDVPLVGFVGRLEHQKGVDVILAAVPELLGEPRRSGGYNRSLGYDLATADAARKQAQVQSAFQRRSSELLQALLRSLGVRRGPSTDTSPVAGSGTPQQRPRGALPERAAAKLTGDGADGGDARNLQLAVLGVGQQWLQDGLAALAGGYPGRAVGYVGFDEPLCHLLIAGCDFLLVPSRWEPCGLVALAALRYGTIPVVAPTGGLLDALAAPDGAAAASATAPAGSGARSGGAAPDGGRASMAAWAQQCSDEDGITSGATGYSGNAGGDCLGIVMDGIVGHHEDSMAKRRAVGSLVRAIDRACSLYGTESFEVLRRKCMARDTSWEQPTQQWEEVLMSVASGKPADRRV